MLHAPVSFLLHATVDRRFLQKCLRQLRVSYSGTKNIAKGVGLQFPFVYLSNKEGTWSHHICREGWRCFKMRTKPFGQRNGLRGTADRWSSAQGGQKCSETEIEIFRNGKKVDWGHSLYWYWICKAKHSFQKCRPDSHNLIHKPQQRTNQHPGKQRGHLFGETCFLVDQWTHVVDSAANAGSTWPYWSLGEFLSKIESSVWDIVSHAHWSHCQIVLFAWMICARAVCCGVVNWVEVSEPKESRRPQGNFCVSSSIGIFGEATKTTIRSINQSILFDSSLV